MADVVAPPILSGLVVKSQSGFFDVETSEGIITSKISGRLKEKGGLKNQDEITSDIVALGDRVTLECQPDRTGLIIAIQEREHILSRVAPSSAVGTSAESQQIIISNLDQAIFVFAATKPRPQPRMLDRLLVVAEKAKLQSIIICINKIDLVKPKKASALFAEYEQIGYPVLRVCALKGDSVDKLRACLAGKISVFTGPSGVGKSSLLNAIQPDLGLQTAHISDLHHKGRHTTRFSQLIKLPDGGYVADTPGIRAIAPWDVEPDELDSYFREFRLHVPNCRFTDCSHIHEPDCAVRAAVESGEITEERYDSYLRLRAELEEQYIY